jgi:hypothetical protein
VGARKLALPAPRASVCAVDALLVGCTGLTHSCRNDTPLSRSAILSAGKPVDQPELLLTGFLALRRAGRDRIAVQLELVTAGTASNTIGDRLNQSAATVGALRWVGHHRSVRRKTLRASVRAGALIADGQKDGTILAHGGNRKSTSSMPSLIPDSKKAEAKSLPQLGISYDQSSQWQQLAGIIFSYAQRRVNASELIGLGSPNGL